MKNDFKNALAKRSGRLKLLSHGLLQKTKDIVIETRDTGTVISWRMVTGIGAGDASLLFFASVWPSILRGCLHVIKTKSHPAMNLIARWTNFCLQVNLIPEWNLGWHPAWMKNFYYVSKANQFIMFAQCFIDFFSKIEFFDTSDNSFQPVI